ncbi:MAG TPA: hypothetical protein VGL65_10355 [Gemmatimonadales bacterium]|jgi:hypothetical protein
MGRNEVLETLPVGRRVAFDAPQGRLWVVCRHCEKWNLVPFDTRLETIDVCDRLFADARLRYSTEHIGIARLAEGLELVRIGRAQRPEFAAWRYGDQFGWRRRVAALQVAGGVAAVGAVALSSHLLLPAVGATFTWQAFNVANSAYRARRAIVRLPEQDGARGAVTRSQLRNTRIVMRPDGNWRVTVAMYRDARAGFVTGTWGQEADFEGDDAIAALGRLLPAINVRGASQRRVQEAVAMLADRPSVFHLLRLRDPESSKVEDWAAALGFHAASKIYRPPTLTVSRSPALRDFTRTYRLVRLRPSERLALEMLAHEDAERAALAGELKLLEREWKAADQLAKIADDLAVSDEVHERFDR